MDSATVQRLQKTLRVRLTKYIPHQPTPKQAAFLLIPGREALYGGAAGGGKSDALLMAALQYVDIPGYAAILFRRTYTDLSLPGALMDRADEWLTNTDAKWHDRDKTWTFPSGATLTFGYLDGPRDHLRYQSAEFQFIGFDELTQFEENKYRYLFSRLRRLEGVNIPLRVRSASNPGGVGHKWVKARFIDPKTRVAPFVPAKLADNPYLDQEEYLESLNTLDPFTRKQLLDGDWSASAPGAKFQRHWFEIVDEIPAHGDIVRYYDLAATEVEPGSADDPDWTVGAKVKRFNGLYFMEHLVRMRKRPHDVEEMVKQTAKIDGRGCPIVIEQEPGASGKQAVGYYIRLLAGYAVQADRVTGEKHTRWNPLASQAQAGNVKIKNGPWVTELLDELEAVGPDPKAYAHDDQVDSFAGGFNFLTEEPPPMRRSRVIGLH